MRGGGGYTFQYFSNTETIAMRIGRQSSPDALWEIRKKYIIFWKVSCCNTTHISCLYGLQTDFVGWLVGWTLWFPFIWRQTGRESNALQRLRLQLQLRYFGLCGLCWTLGRSHFINFSRQGVKSMPKSQEPRAELLLLLLLLRTRLLGYHTGL